MTDQRPIEPSTPRDGDYVRAEGDGWAAEGYYYRREIRSKAGWNVVCLSGEPDERVTILRPVLVEGDRVEWEGRRGVFRRRDDDCYSLIVTEDGLLREVLTTSLTRLPAAPEPAPIEVGDWWKSATGIVAVVLGVDGDTLTWRRLDGSLPLAGRTHVMAESWTRLDGPPEPPVGSVYVITNVDGQPDVWHHHANGLHYCAGSSVGMPWADACSFYTRDLLATLQIVHTLGVE